MGGRDNDNVFTNLWKRATAENGLTTFDGWVAVLLLMCLFYLAAAGWNGLQGKDCPSGFGSGSEIPFKIAGKAGCFFRSIGEMVFPNPDDAGVPTKHGGSVVRPPKAP